MGAHFNELRLGLVASAHVLKHKDVSGAIEGFGWSQLSAIVRFAAGDDAEGRADDEEAMRLRAGR